MKINIFQSIQLEDSEIPDCTLCILKNTDCVEVLKKFDIECVEPLTVYERVR